MDWFESAESLLAKWKTQDQEAWGDFTLRAKQAIALAHKEAERMNLDFIGVEHLLFGLVRLGQDGAANVLVALGLPLETVRQELEAQIGSRPERKAGALIPFTSRAKNVLETARQESKQQGCRYVGTEHLLLGLLKESEGVSANMFKKYGINREQVRQKIIQQLTTRLSNGEEGRERQRE